MSEDLHVLREILAHELETINAYERMLARITEPALRQIIEHVTDEEREHVSEMYDLIMERDPKQRERAAESRTQLAAMALVSSETAAEAAGLPARTLIGTPSPASGVSTPGLMLQDPVPPPPPLFPDGAWSVGSLKPERGGQATS